MAFRPPRRNLLRLPLALSLLWCLFMVALYQRGSAEKDAHTNELALIQVRTLYSQVLDTRSWNAAHGGVYVPESEYGVPNPWIPESQRTLALPGGQRLVLVNPAYMSRQIGDLTSMKGASFRITSHAPLRPENASDAWETEALLRCMDGAREMFRLDREGTSPRYRYLGALYAKKECLSCHADNREGDVRGGISVSLDAQPFLQAIREQESSLRWAYGLMGLTGVVGIGGTSMLARRKRLLAEERERMKSAFLANMSHDMRTPLTGILGMTDLLERPQSEEQRREALRYLHLAGMALLEMVSDITDYAALDAGQIQLTRRPFAVRRALGRCLELFEPQCRAKNLFLRVEVDDSVPATVVGDEFRLRQALGNLIGNAVKFTEQGGICVRVGRGAVLPGAATPAQPDTPDKPPRPAPENAACVLRFTVEDTGVGIAPQDQRRIFERFERGTAASEGYGGTGLGLSIAQDIALLMGGRLDVESRLGQGSLFTLSLHFGMVPEQAAGGEKGTDGMMEANTLAAMCTIPPEARSRRGQCVMVAEDNAITTHYLEQVLTRAGYATCKACNGHEVLDLLENTGSPLRPDLLILDMRMPGMDGLTTARSLRARERRDGSGPLPIVVLSASVSEEERAAFAALGVEAHLLKPVSARELMAVVDAALGNEEPGAAKPGATDAAASVSTQQHAPGVKGVSPPVFDRDGALEDLEGDAALLRRLGALWLTELEERRTELLAAQEAGDMPTVRRVAHAWKNSCAVLHLQRLHALCGMLEKAGPDAWNSLMPEVLAAVEEAAAALNAT